ncbi:copia protein [Tanacetum coccineum]|uniref:Copia protein n=1 Tax=Tanacetum coccineum TaxID=301880 RepID=A0ABQ5A5I7_9ASTR
MCDLPIYNMNLGFDSIDRMKELLNLSGSGVGRGVKKKCLNGSNLEVAKDGVVPSLNVDSGNTQVAITRQSSSGPSDMDVEKDKLYTLEDTTVLGSFPPLPTQVTNSAGNALGKSSYDNVTGKPSGEKLNIRKRMAYPVVANYVRNTWGKYGLVRSMFSSSTGLFSFQFSFRFIWNDPFILKKWHPDNYLLKEDVSTVPIWVKIHGVPVTAFSGDGLSVIATKLGTPLMLDSYTSDMCMQSWGRSSYARVMIEIRADVELKDNIVVAMPRIKGEGYYTCNIHAEYEWKPPRCTNGGISNSANKGTNNVSSSNTLIGEKIDKIERQIYEGKLRVMDDDENPLVLTGIVESDSEVEVVFDKTANLRISTSGKDGSDKGYGTNSLLEQWRDSYPNIDDYDPYDDDMYENRDMF